MIGKCWGKGSYGEVGQGWRFRDLRDAPFLSVQSVQFVQSFLSGQKSEIPEETDSCQTVELQGLLELGLFAK